MNKAAAKPNSDWKDGFLFLGNHLALDFLNTRPVQNGQLIELLPDFSALLRWFRAAGLISSREVAVLHHRWAESAQARRTLRALRDLREKLRKEIPSWERGTAIHRGTIDRLNTLMAEHPMRTRLEANRGKSLTKQYFEPRQPEDLFAPIAHGAATMFSTLNRKRVRKCDQCMLHFHDTSKKGTRRWCSMRLCGNRLKVAAYAARRHQPVDGHGNRTI